MKRNRNRNLAVAAAILIPTLVPAASLWWDSNGAVAGAGVTPSGTWGISAFWSTSSTGTLATANTLTTAVDTLTFSAGSDATGSPVVTVNGTRNALLLSIEEGAVTFSGGTIALGGKLNNVTPGSGITIASGAGNATVSSSLSITGAQVFNVGAGRTLALSTPGSFIRASGSSLNVQGAGSVTSTKTNLAGNKGSTGIVGPWASFGTGTATQYATFSGSTITGLTGTAAATPANVTDTTGLLNYDLADPSGALPATVSANTIRYTGTSSTATTLGATSFTVNGLMNAGTTQWNISAGTLTIGADRELVVNAANHRIQIDSPIRDNSGGASALTMIGSSILYLSGANTYTGVTTISAKLALTGNHGALSPASAIIDNGEFSFSNPNTVTQGVDFAGVISGTGALETNSGASSSILLLTGTNTYTGVTTIGGNGILSVATIGNGGVAGNLGAASSAAANIVFAGPTSATLRYTGVTDSTDRNFTMQNSRSAGFEVTNSTTNLTFTGGSAASTGFVIKTGPGTLTFAGSMAHTGTTTVNAGTLVLDYTATNSSKLSDTSPLILGSGTLQLDRATAASGSHAEIVSSTILSGGGGITRGAGATTAVLQMNALTRNAGSSVDFGAASIASTDTSNATGTGILGPWATINGKDWAKSIDAGASDTAITAYGAYTDVARLGGTHVIGNGATTNVRITEGSGAAANLTLGASTVTINTLNQSSTGGSATIDTAGKTLAVNGILAGKGSSALLVGTAAGSGTLTAGATGGELVLLNYGSNGLTINSVIADNGSASSLTHAGSGTTVLAGSNTYTGKTIISGGKLSLAAESGLGANPASFTADQLTLNGGTVLATGTFSIDDVNRGITLGVSGGTFEVSSGTLTVASTNGITEAVTGLGRLTKTGPGTLTLLGVNTYTGFTTVADGILSLGNATNTLSNSSNVTVAGGTLALGANSDTVSAVTLLSGSITSTTGTLTALNFDVQSGTVSAKLAGAGITMNKTTAGTVTLTGATSFTGGTTILSGVLEAGGAGALASTSRISVRASGTLRLSGLGDRIGDAVPLTFSGGSLETAGLSETAGTFTLAGTATIDLGAGASLLHLADSSALAWSGTLSITNWNGAPAGGGTDELFFGTSASGLTPAQLALISFANPAGFGPGTYGAMMLGTGEIVAIPEPASTGLLVSCLGWLGFRGRRARRR